MSSLWWFRTSYHTHASPIKRLNARAYIFSIFSQKVVIKNFARDLRVNPARFTLVTTDIHHNWTYSPIPSDPELLTPHLHSYRILKTGLWRYYRQLHSINFIRRISMIPPQCYQHHCYYQEFFICSTLCASQLASLLHLIIQISEDTDSPIMPTET